MNELQETRNEIDRLDEDMAVLFEKRMTAVRRIAAYKQEHKLQIRDKAKEAEKIARQKELIKDESLRSFYVMFLQAVMDISCSFQETLIADKK